MNNFFVILAAGKGSRFKKNEKKQYTFYKNLRLFEHSVLKAIKSKLFKKYNSGVCINDDRNVVHNGYFTKYIYFHGFVRTCIIIFKMLRHNDCHPQKQKFPSERCQPKRAKVIKFQIS